MENIGQYKYTVSHVYRILLIYISWDNKVEILYSTVFLAVSILLNSPAIKKQKVLDYICTLQVYGILCHKLNSNKINSAAILYNLVLQSGD